MLETTVKPLSTGVDSGSQGIWIEALPAKVYQTPQYGEVPITLDKLERMVKNFKANVRGQEVATDYDHGADKARGNEASGWYRDFVIKPSSSDPSTPALFANIEFTDQAREEIKGKKWKYFSLMWDDEWMDNDGNVHADVITGGGVTNRPIAKKTMPINFSEVWDEMDSESQKKFALTLLENKEGLASAESKEMEHSEPGTGSPPTPRKDEDGSDDIAIEEGWRRETPPIAKDPEGRKAKVPEFSEKDHEELRRMFDVPVDADGDKVVEAAKLKFGELDELKKEVNKSNQRHEFAEKYPELWEEHNDLMERTRTNSAKAFSESVKTLRKAEGYGLKEIKNAGLSMASKDKIEEVHKKFSEGKGTIEDFEEVVKTIMNGGIVSFGEIGSSKDDDRIPEFDATTAPGVAHSRKVFAEVIAKIQRDKPELSYRDAMAEAAKQQPELSDAWATTLNA